MEHFVNITCPHCNCKDVCKNGHRKNGTQRWRCNNKSNCGRSFQIDYTYNAHKLGVKEQILEQTLNSSGVRDVARNLHIAKGTVIADLKKKEPAEINPYFLDKTESDQLGELDIQFVLSTEWDEFWSFIGKKAVQRWTWYAIERKSGCILAYHNGRRTDESLKALVEKLAHLPIVICHTDDWAAYKKHLPVEYRQIVGKDNTWKIERKNLNFRTHIKRLSRKTICFSKNEEIHDKVIGMYINKYYYKSGTFGAMAA